MNTITSGLTHEEREHLLANGGLSTPARIALYSAAVLAEYELRELVEAEPLVLANITDTVGCEIRDASLRLGLRRLARTLTIQIMRLTVSDGRRFSGQILGGKLRMATMTPEERTALIEKAVMARRAKAAASEVVDKPRGRGPSHGALGHRSETR